MRLRPWPQGAIHLPPPRDLCNAPTLEHEFGIDPLVLRNAGVLQNGAFTLLPLRASRSVMQAKFPTGENQSGIFVVENCPRTMF